MNITIFPFKKFVFIFCFMLTGFAGRSASFFVSTIGSDSNPGTFIEPFETIQKGLNSMNVGDTVFVRGGVYFEQLFWTVDGALGQECVLTNYQNETVIVDGAGSAGLNMMFIGDISHIHLNGIDFQNLYIQDAIGIFVVGEGENIKITNCEIKDIGWTNDPNADPYSINPSGQGHGILINGRTTLGLKDITINDNHIHDVITGNSEALTLVGNINGFEVARDTIHHTTNIGIDIAGHYTWAIDAGVHDSLNQSRNGVVANCLIYENRRFDNIDAPPGLYSDGAKNVVFKENISYNNGVGMSIGCENLNKVSENIVAVNNLVYNNDNEGIYFGSNASGSIIKNCLLKNNTFYQNGIIEDWHSEVFLQNNEDCVIAQNIMVALNSQHHSLSIFDPYMATNLIVDNNLVYRYNGDFSFLYVEGSPSQFTPTNSLIANPLFVNNSLVNPDFQLLSSSSAIDKGLNNYEQQSSVDLNGNARLINGALDLGAYEHQTGGCPDTLVINHTNVLSGVFTAKNLIQFDLEDETISDQIQLYVPNVEFLSDGRLLGQITLFSDGCQN